MKRLVTGLLLFVFPLFSQDLTGIRICIDPGHGGTESDDRPNEEVGFYESASNLTKGLELRDILLRLGADVAITRTGNNDPPPTEAGGTPDDPTLSQRVAMANNFNADYFNSIHSNGYNGTVNYTLTIYNGHTNSPRIPASQTIAEILAPRIFEANRTTHHRAVGDLTLNPTWSKGYGVLYPANMPAVITEGSFHDYPPETWRLMNTEYRKNEAHAIARAILQFFAQPGFSTGSLAGILRDSDLTVDYFHLGGTADSRIPINNFTATIDPGNIIYHGDDLNNGYFYVDSLTPGEYTVTVEVDGYGRDTSTVTVLANKTVFADFNLPNQIPPIVTNSYPANNDTLFPAWDVPVLDFSKAMNQSSVEAAFSIAPAVEGAFFFTKDLKKMAFLPADTLEFLTHYTITIDASATDSRGLPIDGDQDGVGGDAWVISFRTGPTDVHPPTLVSATPRPGSNTVELRPVINLVWNEELNASSVSSEMVKLERTTDASIQPIDFEHHVINEQSVFVLYAQSDLLGTETYRIVVSPGFEDLLGNRQTNSFDFTITTANFDYSTISIDNFESNVSINWWEPGQSGGTYGNLPGETGREPSSLSVSNHGSTTSMHIKYGWDKTATSWLLREYLQPSAAPRSVHFTSSSIMQAFVFGDGNGNKFRFCVDDNVTGSDGKHEVSPWFNIDWYGWKLISWDMAADGTGTWIGDGVLNGTLEFDSIQLTYTPGQPNIGSYYIDELRLATRNYLSVDRGHAMQPIELSLLPNYPNPFNPVTNIPFLLPDDADVKIKVFNMRGELVDLIFSGYLEAGRHVTRWNGSAQPSGVYVVVMETGYRVVSRKITVLK